VPQLWLSVELSMHWPLQLRHVEQARWTAAPNLASQSRRQITYLAY
jgi:hypothetical protein